MRSRTVKLTAPTNFDDELVPALAEAGVVEVYGKLTQDAAGGGRPSYVLPSVNRVRLEQHLKVVHDAGMRFNYLLNAPTLGGIESTANGYHNIRQLMDEVVALGVDSITVANPFFLELAKRHYPELAVKVSAFANVVSVLQAKQWADMGASVITASPPHLNRSLRVLEEMAKAVSAEIQVVVNNGCLQSCVWYQAHAALHAHASQEGHWSKGFVIDHCVMNCRLARLQDPALYIRGDWIRPEDVAMYEELGVVWFKLVNRSNPTSTIIERAQAYSRRRYDGNLMNLLEHAMDHHDAGSSTWGSRLRKAKTFVRPTLANPLRLKELAKLTFPRKPIVHLDNRSLDGFIDFFKTHECSARDCDTCGYCQDVADRVLRVDGETVEEYRRRYKETLDKFLDGHYFKYL